MGQYVPAGGAAVTALCWQGGDSGGRGGPAGWQRGGAGGAGQAGAPARRAAARAAGHHAPHVPGAGRLRRHVRAGPEAYAAALLSEGTHSRPCTSCRLPGCPVHGVKLGVPGVPTPTDGNLWETSQSSTDPIIYWKCAMEVL